MRPATQSEQKTRRVRPNGPKGGPKGTVPFEQKMTDGDRSQMSGAGWEKDLSPNNKNQPKGTVPFGLEEKVWDIM